MIQRKDVFMNYSDKKSIKDVRDLAGKRVLLRCDLNVPLDDDCRITDTKRIDESLATINYLLQNGARVVICSHLGRPKGEFNQKLSLKPVADYLSNVLNKNLPLSKDVIGNDAQKLMNSLKDGEACLLENLRFHSEEETNNREFAQKLASFADLFVFDAFGTAHRAHASTVGVTEFLPSVSGFLVQKELKIMENALKNPKRPLVSILGGAKVSDKIGVINSLLEKVDILIIGGGMAYTFINSLGYSVGTSLCESDKLELARDIMIKANEKNVKLVLPVDNKVGREYDPNTEAKIVDADKIPEGWMGLDIGVKTAKLFSETVKEAGTVIWNGPMGVSEWDNFASGTLAVANAIAESGAVSIIGGGDSAAAIEKLGLADKMTHISTGGGASLQFLEGKDLPAIVALNDN